MPPAFMAGGFVLILFGGEACFAGRFRGGAGCLPMLP